jgi:hypothetical protein
MLELCDYRSLDSYRARVAGPTYIIKELYHLIDDFKRNKIKSFETVIACKEEAYSILECDKVLDYGRISKVTLLEMIKGLKDEKLNIEHNLPKIEFSLYYLLAINDVYILNLVDRIEKIVLQATPNANNEESDISVILRDAGFLITELINRGFAKAFIARFCRSIFVYDENMSFDTAWGVFKKRVVEQEKDDFSVVFKIVIPEKKTLNSSVFKLKNILSLNDLPFIKSFNELAEGQDYLKSNKNTKFILEVVRAYDHYEALKEAKTKLNGVVDFMHLGHSDIKFEVLNNALVINHRLPQRAGVQSLSFHIDDSFKSNESSYVNLYSKFLALKSSSIVSKESIAKIESAVKYLRAGNEAVELEQKFLSYWIGLENIFSNHNANANTFLRIKKYMPLAHMVSYTKRNIYEFHKSLKRLDVAKLVPGYNDDLNYLLDSSTYDKIILMHGRSPLLSSRATAIKNMYFKSDIETKAVLVRHKSNLERHLVRMYRIRNELVHNVAAFQNIENITSNLRYYLFFIINKSAEYFYGCKAKNIDGKLVDMDDFFLYQEMLWDGIERVKYDFKSLIKVPHPVKSIA